MQFGQYPYAIAATAPRAGRAHFRLLGLTTLAYKMDNLRWFALQGSSWWAATEAVHATAKQPKFFLLTSRRRPPRCGSADKAPHISPIPSLPLSALAATQPRCGSAGKAPRISAVTHHKQLLHTSSPNTSSAIAIWADPFAIDTTAPNLGVPLSGCYVSQRLPTEVGDLQWRLTKDHPCKRPWRQNRTSAKQPRFFLMTHASTTGAAVYD